VFGETTKVPAFIRPPCRAWAAVERPPQKTKPAWLYHAEIGTVSNPVKSAV